MFQTLLNPFNRIAGFTALGYGCIAMLLTAAIAAPCGVYFFGTLNIKVSEPMPFSLVFALLILGWMTIATCFFITGMLFSKSKIRAVDVFGTFALARAPYLIAAPFGLLPGLWNLNIQQQISPETAVSLTIAVIVFLFVAIWVVVLSYYACAVSTNVKNKWLFTGVLIVSEIVAIVLSAVLSFALLLGSSGKAPTAEDAEHVAIAQKFVARFFADTNDDPLEQFQVIDAMKSFATADTFKKLSSKIIADYGKPDNIEKIEVVQHSEIRRSVFLFYHCEKRPLKMWVTFDDKIISGFHY